MTKDVKARTLSSLFQRTMVRRFLAACVSLPGPVAVSQAPNISFVSRRKGYMRIFRYELEERRSSRGRRARRR